MNSKEKEILIKLLPIVENFNISNDKEVEELRKLKKI
jgi:hypothetical protein